MQQWKTSHILIPLGSLTKTLEWSQNGTSFQTPDSHTSNECLAVNATQEEFKDDVASLTVIITVLIKEIHLWSELMTLENKLNAWTLTSMKGYIKK